MLALLVGFCASTRTDSDSLEPNEIIAIDAMSSPSPSLVARLLFWRRILGSTACAAVVMVILGAVWLYCNRESDDDRYRTVDYDESDDEVKLERIDSMP
jgi:hypothetical protein